MILFAVKVRFVKAVSTSIKEEFFVEGPFYGEILTGKVVHPQGRGAHKVVLPLYETKEDAENIAEAYKSKGFHAKVIEVLVKSCNKELRDSIVALKQRVNDRRALMEKSRDTECIEEYEREIKELEETITRMEWDL